ncbi:hypothetical protein [Campylobacter gastrosuis]|uniref:WG repeat-containing protein n=1 Tax=Campylobacter gastrosuis TaxID=2974576 RepID=A0ABT7HT39_9BACT|nr:hypothetical protein [Campylobacter gastrosuis]MDL0089870.1 hypothetical protein [Campylobacter gastrosuis]
MWKLPDGHFLKLNYDYIAKINMSDDFISGYLYKVDEIIKHYDILFSEIPAPFIFRVKDKYGLIDMQGNFVCKYDYLSDIPTNNSKTIAFIYNNSMGFWIEMVK